MCFIVVNTIAIGFTMAKTKRLKVLSRETKTLKVLAKSLASFEGLTVVNWRYSGCRQQCMMCTCRSIVMTAVAC